VPKIKAKYFSSLSQYYRGLADNAASKHGDALARFIQAETLAKEAHRSAQAFSASFVNTMSPNLPVDAGSSIQEKTKIHLVICTDKKNEAQQDNDLIYSAICPPFESLSVVERTAVASAIPIQEVYGSPDVQKTIGQDIFIRLVPLSVHESASVYSEEKAKLVRAEVEKAEQSDGEARSAIDGLGVKEGLTRYKAMAEGEVAGGEEVPLEVRRWKEDITVTEERESVDTLVQELIRLKTDVNRDLDTISRDLEIESKDCEMMRVKYEHLWPQSPSAILTKTQRKDLKSHFSALEAAAVSDQQVTTLWDSVRSDILLLLSPQVEQLFLERGGFKPDNLLDLDIGSEADDTAERAKIKGYVDEIEERLTRLNMISKERSEVLKDLKDKVCQSVIPQSCGVHMVLISKQIQADDVSHLLLLNRRNTNVEPALFAAELEKFRPYQQRLASTVHHQELAFQELTTLWKGLKDLAGRGPGARKWEEREKRKKDTVKRFSRARDGYMEVRDGLAYVIFSFIHVIASHFRDINRKGLQFYGELTELTSKLSASVRSYVAERTAEKEALIAKLEAERRLSFVASPPPLASRPHVLPSPPLSNTSIESQFSSLNLREQPKHHPSVSSQQTSLWSQVNSPPPSSSQDNGSRFPYRTNEPQNNSSYASLPPPPPPPPQHQQQHAYRTSSYTPSAVSSLPPPSQSQVPAFLPPPSQLPTRSSYLVPSTPQHDPYATLAMFNPPTTSPSTQQGEHNAYYNQQQQYAQAHGGSPQHPQYHSYQMGQQPAGFSLSPPPPPPANLYGYSQEYGRHPK